MGKLSPLEACIISEPSNPRFTAILHEQDFHEVVNTALNLLVLLVVLTQQFEWQLGQNRSLLFQTVLCAAHCLASLASTHEMLARGSSL